MHVYFLCVYEGDVFCSLYVFESFVSDCKDVFFWSFFCKDVKLYGPV